MSEPADFDLIRARLELRMAAQIVRQARGRIEGGENSLASADGRLEGAGMSLGWADTDLGAEMHIRGIEWSTDDDWEEANDN